MPRCRAALLPLMLAAALAGCGDSGSGGGTPAAGSAKPAAGSAKPAADSPQAAVDAFVGAVSGADWKGACARLAPEGQVELSTELGLRHAFVPQSEQDEFGLWKDCAATLGTRAAAVRAVFSGAGPAGAERTSDAHHAIVTTPEGSWAVVVENPSKDWRVARFPR
jgi:hypothetical protein